MLSKKSIDRLNAEAFDLAREACGTGHQLAEHYRFARLIEAAVLLSAARDLARFERHGTWVVPSEELRHRAARCAKAAKEASRG